MTTTSDTTHERIASVWVVDTTGGIAARWWTVDECVQYLDKGGSRYVVEPPRTIAVVTRVSSTGRKYIQTVADGQWTNNLLALPKL